MSLFKYYKLLCRRFSDRGGPEIVNFAERTLSWITSSTRNHINKNHDKYSFNNQDIKILSIESNHDIKALIPCSEQVTSQWFINKMIQNKYYVHSFTPIYTPNFDAIKNTFKLSTDSIESIDNDHNDDDDDNDNNKNVVLYDKQNVLDEIKMAVQVNGKTRDIINIKKNLEEKKIKEIVFNSPRAVKHLKDKKVIKTIFVKNKIINYIVSN